jgi:two-component sensor histidine kinase
MLRIVDPGSLPLGALFNSTFLKTRALPRWLRVGGSVLCVGLAFGVRALVDPIWPPGFPFLLAMGGILASAALFAEGCGLLATGLSAAAAAYWYLPPYHSFYVSDGSHVLALFTFILIGSLLTLVIETLHHALETERVAVGRAVSAEQARAKVLEEFRHRTRNDLQALVGLLLLRARASSDEARDGLREGAAHALGLARVHSRLAEAEPDARGDVVIDTGGFIDGLAGDIVGALNRDGLRPIQLVVEAEAHVLDTERAVHLGQILNECLACALRYGFPEERHGRIHVRFAREGSNFVLEVGDDGVGFCEGSKPGLGTRVLASLAAQLRGSFSRAGECGVRCLLTFPVAMPGRFGAPAALG